MVAFVYCVLALVSALFCFPQFANRQIDAVNSKIPLKIPHVAEKPFNLGLDVKGGVHLEYQADLSQVAEKDRATVMEGVKDLIERRINSYGVAEPQIQVSGQDRLIVELPGIESIRPGDRLDRRHSLAEFFGTAAPGRNR